VAEKSTTETGADQGSSDSQDESLLEDQQQPTADEQTDAGNDASDGSNDGRQDDDTTQEDEANENKLAKYAKGQGIDDISDLSERELKLLKAGLHGQQDFSAGRQEQSQEARKAIEDVYSPSGDDDDDYDADAARDQRLALVEAKADLMDFYAANPEAREYDAEMGKVLVKEVEKYGQVAGQILSQNKDRLLREARALKGDNSVEAAREAGRRDERTLLRKRQEGSAQGADASDTHKTAPKITRDWVQHDYDPSNPEHQQMLDEAIAAGDLY
jgi:hypothetical protein